MTISWLLRKIVSARSTVTAVSIRRAGLVDAGDALGQPRVVRIGTDQVIGERIGHAGNI